MHGVGVPKEPSGQQHVSTGNADCTAPRAHVVGPSELGPVLDQAIKMGCVDISQSKTADGFEALVVSKQKQDIGLFLCFC